MGVLAAAAVLGLAASSPVRDVALLPHNVDIPTGAAIRFPWSRFLPVTVESEKGIELMHDPHRDAWGLRAKNPGDYAVQLKWFGWIPFKKLPVKVEPVVTVVPGGQSIGVIVRTRGVLVTGYDPQMGPRGPVDPAQEAGIQPGDVLLAVNGRPLSGDHQLSSWVQRAGAANKTLAITDQGPRQLLTRYVHPLWNPGLRRYQIGVAVRDSASGVGTLTFWNPSNKRFTALGHSITDGTTRQPIGLDGGELMGAAIVGVVPGTPDSPGEKVGVLTSRSDVGGTVTSNGMFGLSGQLAAPPLVGPRAPIPVATVSQVHPGPAVMITVLRGQKPERFPIQILDAYPQAAPATKGLLFRIADPRLLKATGGVIQGMSGSPIIQDGRLVGAVTHVLVSRPHLGYGCYAEWMVKEKGFSGPGS